MKLKKAPPGTYRKLFTYVRPYMWAFILGVLGSAVVSGLDAYVTHFLKPLLDVGFIDRKTSFLKIIPFMIIGVFLLRAGGNFVGSYFMTKVGREVVKSMRERLFAHLMKLPASFYDANPSGPLLSKIIYNSDQVANACTNAVSTAVQSLVLVIGLMIVMFTISWRLTLSYIIVVPILVFVVRFTSKRMRRLSGKVQNFLGDITQVAQEAIDGYKVVKIFGAQEYEQNKFSKACQNNRDQAMKVVVTSSLSTTFVYTIGGVVLAATIYVVTMTSTKTFGLTAGGFVSMVVALLTIIKPMRDYVSVTNVIQQGLAGADSIFEILQEPAEHDTGTTVLLRAKGKIEYRDVSFRYKTSSESILNHINFIAEPGQMIALVGRSGGGKSTIVSLLPRFYDVMSGQILIDDHDIHDLTLESLRSNISIVTQQVTLFNDTIANNIAYGCHSTVTRGEIEEAAKAAHAWEFIVKLPQGLDTPVGENGVLLSGGQRQRLAIARAILRQSPILILDEATSALDTESERKIQQAFDVLMQGRTSLVIAHRLSTIEHADMIMVLDGGRIVETGKHIDLLARNGAYAELYNMQFKKHEKL